MKNKLNWLIFIICLLGILLSGYLWWIQVSDRIIPCTLDGCDNVLKSEYGKLFGVPMSVFGVFYYIITAGLAFLRFFIKDKILDLLLFISIIWGIIFSIYLRYLEFFKINAICEWCWLSVLFILILLTAFLFERKYAKR